MKRMPWWVWVAGVLVIALVLGAGVLLGRTLGDKEREQPETPGESTEAPEPTGTVEPGDDTPAGEPAKTTTVRVYLSRGEYLGVAARTVPETKAVATAAMQELLAGTSAAEQGWGLSSQIPAGTKLRGLTVNDGTARVDLSGEFAAGGGTLSATMRLAQVVYTLTQFPSVQRVVLLIDGTQIDVFSGEGIVLDHPQTRADYEPVLPAIFVESPVPGETVSSPIRLRGTANTFEASFMVRIEDANGATLNEVPAMATSGTGTRGTFDVSVTYPLASAGAGWVVVYESSAKDGSEINTVAIPVVPKK